MMNAASLTEQMVDEDGDQEVGPAHAGENESCQCHERPEGHLDLAILRLCVLDGKVHRHTRQRQGQGRKNSKDDEKSAIRHRSLYEEKCWWMRNSLKSIY
jgi:hypothetical protein